MIKKTGILLTFLFIVAASFLQACQPKGAQPLATPSAAPLEEEFPATVPPETPATLLPPSFTEDRYAAVTPNAQAIIFWHPYSGEAESRLQEIITEFNASNPWGITVQAENQGSYRDIFDKMLAFMNSAGLPHLAIATPEQAAVYQLGAMLVDMDELIYSQAWGFAPEQIADFFPGYFERGYFPAPPRVRLGIPLSQPMQVLYYNQNWLTELGYNAPPSNPDQFREMACAAAQQPFSGATAEGHTGYLLRVDAANLANWIFAFGGALFDDAAAQYKFDTPPATQALQFLQLLIEQGCIALVSEDQGDLKAFEQGTALFSVGASADFERFLSAGVGAPFTRAVTALPHTSPTPRPNLSGPLAVITRSTPEQQLAAWLFLEHFLDPAVQSRWARASREFPVRASAAAALADYFSANPLYATAFDWLPYGAAEPAAPGYDQVRAMAAEAFYAVTQGAEVNAVLAALTVEANASLAEQMAATPQSPDPWVDVDPSGQTIVFWHQQPPARQAALDEIIWKFNSANPWGITVVPEYQGSADELIDKTLSSLGSSEAPNLIEAYQEQATAPPLSENLLDLRGLVSSVKWGLSPQEQADFFPGISAQDLFPTAGNARLGFPTGRSMQVLYYNADWLAELRAAGAIDFDGPPATPAQFQAAACAATASTGSLGYQINPQASTFAAWTFAFGGELFDLQTGQYSFDSQAAVEAMTFLQGLVNAGCAAEITGRYSDQNDFSAGNLLFTVDSSAGLPFYASAIAEGSGFTWSVAALPHTTAGPVTNLYGPSLNVLQSTPEAELAAWLFVKYFTGADVQAQWAQLSSSLPPRASTAALLTDFFQANPPYRAAFDLLPYGVAEPSTPGYGEVRAMLAEALAAILQGAEIAETLTQLNLDANIQLAEQTSP